VASKLGLLSAYLGPWHHICRGLIRFGRRGRWSYRSRCRDAPAYWSLSPTTSGSELMHCTDLEHNHGCLQYVVYGGISILSDFQLYWRLHIVNRKLRNDNTSNSQPEHPPGW
jgi:hypothetical protein